MRGSKRSADTPPDDPRATNTDVPEVEPTRGAKRQADFEPDDPRLAADGDESEVVIDMPVPASQPTAHRPASTLDHECGKCGTGFRSRNALHRHLNKTRHLIIDEDEQPVIYGCEQDSEETRRSSQEQRELQASQIRQAMIDHFESRCHPNCNDITARSGSVMGSPPGTDEAGGWQENDEHASGQMASQPNPPKEISSLSSHPGPKVKTSEIKSRDLKWVDIGSGVMSRTFVQATHMTTTSKGGPNICDVHSRKIWSLSTGKMIDDCVIDDTTDQMLGRELAAKDDIRVEVTLKNAVALFERKGPDVCEIYSQPRVCQEAMSKHLQPGWSLDLTTKDPATGDHWDLSQPKVQSRVRKLVRDTQPYCIIGSPPCTPFSPLQEIGRAKRDPKVMANELARGKEHIKFCLEIYAMQLNGKRHFVHEHPERSRAWDMPEVVDFLLRPNVDSTVLHMCAFGMTAKDEQGEGLVQKATRVMSSSDEVIKQVTLQCSNRGGGRIHRHVHLIQGRAKYAQVYPRLFGERLCEGIAAQKKLDSLGVQSRPLMSVEQMSKAAGQTSSGECPSEALHETGGTGMVAFDDVSGQQLEPSLMIKARADEIAYFREMGVYEKVNVSECWAETGKAPIAVRWVDINKGDTQNPNYRSRLVAKEFNTGVRPELYAATPPSEVLRLMLSLVASGKSQGIGLMYADVSRAYFYAKAVRPVYVKLPDEDWQAGDEHRCGKLQMSMYGTRDAALNWALEYGDTLRAAGYVQGKANPCLFYKKANGVAIMVHGDDFVAVGPEAHLIETRKTLEDKYKIKVEKLGCGSDCKSEMRILNKVVRATDSGITLRLTHDTPNWSSRSLISRLPRFRLCPDPRRRSAECQEE